MIDEKSTALRTGTDYIPAFSENCQKNFFFRYQQYNCNPGVRVETNRTPGLQFLIFDLVYPNFKGTCIEFRNGIMQVC